MFQVHAWVDFFDNDDRARPALPLLLAQEVAGIGFPLACDFLKDLGYVSFAKPDVHIRGIFRGLGLCGPGGDYELFRAVIRVAENAGVSPYGVDKIFWLVGSGKYHADEHIGRSEKAGGRKKAFIEHAKPILERLAQSKILQ